MTAWNPNRLLWKWSTTWEDTQAYCESKEICAIVQMIGSRVERPWEEKDLKQLGDCFGTRIETRWLSSAKCGGFALQAQIRVLSTPPRGADEAEYRIGQQLRCTSSLKVDEADMGVKDGMGAV